MLLAATATNDSRIMSAVAPGRPLCMPNAQLHNFKESDVMLWIIFVILLVLWLLGMVSAYTLGGYIHILLIVALAVVLIRVTQGRRQVA